MRLKLTDIALPIGDKGRLGRPYRYTPNNINGLLGSDEIT